MRNFISFYSVCNYKCILNFIAFKENMTLQHFFPNTLPPSQAGTLILPKYSDGKKAARLQMQLLNACSSGSAEAEAMNAVTQTITTQSPGVLSNASRELLGALTGLTRKLLPQISDQEVLSFAFELDGITQNVGMRRFCGSKRMWVAAAQNC